MGLSSLVDSVSDILDPGDVFGREATEVAGEIDMRLMEEALNLRKELFGELRETQEPVRGARDEALGMIRGLRTGDFSLPQDPTVPFQTEEASRNIRNMMAARGKLNSGGRLMAEQDAAAQIASQDINRNINRLLNMAGFSTGDLSSSNALLTGAAGGIAGSQIGLNQAASNAAIRNQNVTNQMLNTGLTLGAGLWPQQQQQQAPSTLTIDGMVYDTGL